MNWCVKEGPDGKISPRIFPKTEYFSATLFLFVEISDEDGYKTNVLNEGTTHFGPHGLRLPVSLPAHGRGRWALVAYQPKDYLLLPSKH